MAILSAIYFVVMVLLLFGITIFIHELGHFVVARKLGMRADVFSIGFGHAIWKRKRHGVLYKVGWIPFGGYVALPQMEPGGGTSKDDDGNEISLPKVAPWRKILVALAGAVGNIILAVFLAFVIFWLGKPSSLQETSSVVGFVDTNSVAYAKGLRIGDEIVKINSTPVSNWNDVSVTAALSASDDVKLLIRNHGEERMLTLATKEGALGVKGVQGMVGVEGPSYCMVGSTMPGSSAEAAEVKKGDMVVSFGGVELHSIHHMVDVVKGFRDTETPMVVEREGELVTLNVTPQWNPEIEKVLIGIQFDHFHMNKNKLVHPKPSQQIKEHASMIFTTLKALVTPNTAKKAGKAIGGPPMIFQYLWVMLKTSFVMALWFTCLLNVNLAIINLMPLPVLDGGHIVFSLIEMVARRPVHERVIGGVTAVFAVLLVGAMLFLSYRDIDRMINPIAPTQPAAPAEDPVPAQP